MRKSVSPGWTLCVPSSALTNGTQARRRAMQTKALMTRRAGGRMKVLNSISSYYTEIINMEGGERCEGNVHKLCQRNRINSRHGGFLGVSLSSRDHARAQPSAKRARHDADGGGQAKADDTSGNGRAQLVGGGAVPRRADDADNRS